MSTIGVPNTRSGLAFVLVAPLVMGLTPQPQWPAARSGPRTTAAASTSQNRDLASLPLPAQASISAVLGRDSVPYHAISQVDGFRVENPNHALIADFSAQAVEVQSGTTHWGMALSGYGYGQDLRPVSTVAPQASANRVEYRRGPLTEWYVNGPLGLEQGFTLEAPPGPRPDGEPLTLALELSGPWQPRLDADRAGLTFRQADGSSVLRYGSLSSYDSAGRELAVWLDVQQGTQLRLRVDDTGARYPLVIDPLVQTETGRAKLTASDGKANDSFGFVAISGDTVVVGAYLDDIGANGDQGSAYVYVEPTSGWGGNLTETAKLTASDGAPNDNLGISVAVSGDTVVVGSFDDVGANVNQGSAYVFVKPTDGWGGSLTETAKLTASDGEASDLFGTSVAISGDTVVAGVRDTADQGSAYVFVEPTGGWGGNLTETARLMASDGASPGLFGVSVAISNDTIVVSAVVANHFKGAAYLFVEPAGGWGGTLTETAKLTASDGKVLDNFGSSVGVSQDTVVVGAPRSGSAKQGSAYLYLEPIDGWGGSLTENVELTARDGADGDLFGASLSISGNTVVVGAFLDDVGANIDQGSAYVFDRSRE